MAKGNAIVMYLEQARIHGEPIGVTRSEVLFTKPNGYTVQPHNRVVSKADNKTMGESFLNELIYVLVLRMVRSGNFLTTARCLCIPQMKSIPTTTVLISMR